MTGAVPPLAKPVAALFAVCLFSALLSRLITATPNAEVLLARVQLALDLLTLASLVALVNLLLADKDSWVGRLAWSERLTKWTWVIVAPLLAWFVFGVVI